MIKNGHEYTVFYPLQSVADTMLLYPISVTDCTTLGSANRKIDIFKITCKVLLCVEVGLIKKTLAWQ